MWRREPDAHRHRARAANRFCVRAATWRTNLHGHLGPPPLPPPCSSAAPATEPPLPAGGAVVCAGPGFRGSFCGCLFKDCNLYAVHGAAATLQRCALWCVQRALQLPAALRGPAVLASGTGTNVMLNDCVVVAFTHAAIADAGATVTAAATSAEHCTSGYIANGTGSHVALTGCALKGAKAFRG